MSEQKERGEDSGGELWTSSWEQQCLDELDSEPNLDDRLPQERQFAVDKLWYSFQTCASAVTHLYKLGENYGIEKEIVLAILHALNCTD